VLETLGAVELLFLTECFSVSVAVSLAFLMAFSGEAEVFLMVTLIGVSDLIVFCVDDGAVLWDFAFKSAADLVGVEATGKRCSVNCWILQLVPTTASLTRHRSSLLLGGGCSRHVGLLTD